MKCLYFGVILFCCYTKNNKISQYEKVPEYYYDTNGNMIKDNNKELSQIIYNRLNLPELIVYGKSRTIKYTYDAAGIKLAKEIYDAGSISRTDYIGNYIYENRQLKYILTDYGKIIVHTAAEYGSGEFPEITLTRTYTRQYNLTDHLGNVRVTFEVINDSAQIVQEDSYYPFGMTQNGLSYTTLPDNQKNLYLYNGKELQEDFGLDWYDYGARFYDAELGVWHVADPMAEKHLWASPYQYAQNNPIKYIDPDGMFETVYITGKEADETTRQLNNSTSMNITRDTETGKISASGDAVTEADKTLLEAINSETIDVNINATNSNYNENENWFVGGSFGGSEVKEDGKVVAGQTVNPNHTKAIDKMNGIPEGVTVLHEVMEAYNGAVDSPGANAPTFEDVANKTDSGKAYLKAHNKTVKTDPRYKSPNISKGADGIYISKFPYNRNIPTSLNPEILLFKFKKK